MTEVAIRICDNFLAPKLMKHDVIFLDVSGEIRGPVRITNITGKIVTIESASQSLQCILLKSHRSI